MKYKSNEIAAKLAPILEVGRPYIFTYPRATFSDVDDKRIERALDDLRNLIGATMRASLQLHSMYDDTAICHKMIGTYPWKKHRISRGKHLEFVWMQFTNLCYLFEERFKLFMTLQHRTMLAFGKRKTGSVSEGTKNIRKTLGGHIKERGQNTHEWSTSNPHATHFASIEFINSLDPQEDGPLGNVVGQFRVTRLIMRWEIETALKFMEAFLIDLFERQIPELATCASTFNQIVDAAKRHKVTANGNEITAFIDS